MNAPLFHALEAAPAPPAASPVNTRFLKETPLLDFSHPAIASLVEQRGWSQLGQKERIKAIYTFVKDEILFGYNSDDDLPASEVLKDGNGQCNTKATLFMALLRAVGIPCRFHGFTIHKRLQKGAVTGIFYLIAPRDILHSWVEVQLAGRWINLEGLILDRQYLASLQAQNPDCQGSFCAYGAATDNFWNPAVEWAGSDTYIQKEGTNRDYGLFDAPDDFYAQVGTNIRGWKRWFFVNWIRHVMNGNVAKIRNAKHGAA